MIVAPASDAEHEPRYIDNDLVLHSPDCIDLVGRNLFQIALSHLVERVRVRKRLAEKPGEVPS